MTIWCTCQSIGNILGQQVGSYFINNLQLEWYYAILFCSIFLFICAFAVLLLLIPFPRDQEQILEQQKGDRRQTKLLEDRHRLKKIKKTLTIEHSMFDQMRTSYSKTIQFVKTSKTKSKNYTNPKQVLSISNNMPKPELKKKQSNEEIDKVQDLLTKKMQEYEEKRLQMVVEFDKTKDQ